MTDASSLHTIALFKKHQKQYVEPRYFQVRTKWIPKAKRSVLIQSNYWSHRELRYEARALQKRLRHLIHKNVYGFVRGRGLSHLILRIAQWRVDGRHILKIDIKKAYRNTDLKRLNMLLAKAGVVGPANYIYVDLHWRPLFIQGLAEGLHTSPVFLAVYMSPFIKRISKDYEAAIYGDDLFIALKSPEEMPQAIALVKMAAAKNHYKRSQENGNT